MNLKTNILKELEPVINSLQETEEGQLRGGFAMISPSSAETTATNTAKNCECINVCTTTTQPTNSGENCVCFNICRRSITDDSDVMTPFTLTF